MKKLGDGQSEPRMQVRVSSFGCWLIMQFGISEILFGSRVVVHPSIGFSDTRLKMYTNDIYRYKRQNISLRDICSASW